MTTKDTTHKTTSPLVRKAIALGYAFICHSSFVIGTATMITMMYYGLSRSLGTLDDPWRWIANGALILQFPIVHSFLLTQKGRKILARMAPADLGADLSSTSFVIIASLQLILLFAFWSPTGIIWWQAEGMMLVVLTVLYLASWGLLAKSMMDAGLPLQSGLLGWWAVYRNVKPVYPRMPTDGLFSLSRQPIYVAFTLTLWTVPTWTPDQLVLAICFTIYCLVGPLFKENRFRKIFGKEFEEYSKHIPYWLPRIGSNQD